MEKQPNLKNRILKILPKAAAAVTVTFQNPPFSPGRDHKLRSDHQNTSRWVKHKGFSGPMIPDEARRKPKDGSGSGIEPTSPKVSCMGQIKHKKKQIKQAKAKAKKSTSMPKDTKRPVDNVATPRGTETEVKKNKQHASKFQRMMLFHRAKTSKPAATARKSDGEGNKEAVLDRSAPPVGQMKRFASGRDAFANFDWKAQVAPDEIDTRDYYSDEDMVDSDAEEEEEEEDTIIPFSAPIMGGSGGGVPNLQPRKEINLWKRRTMAPPRPLQLDPVLTAK